MSAAPLRDPTGSTRFVTIPIDDCRPQLDWGKANRDAIWARAVEEFFSGVDWDRCDEAECQLIAERNEDFTEVDPWADQVEELLNNRQQSVVDLPADEDPPRSSTPLESPPNDKDNRAAKRVRQIAASLGWWVAQRRHQGRPRKGLWPPTAPRPVNTVSTPRC